jgi:starch synthase
VEWYKTPTFANVSKLAIDLADGVIKGSPKINSEVEKYIKKSGKPVLDYIAGDEYINAYSDFYDAVLEEMAELVH